MNSVERVIAICKERNIKISRLEKDCGFSNGYIKQLKKGQFPDNRLRIIAEYLKEDPEYLSTGVKKAADQKDGGVVAESKDRQDLIRLLPRLSEKEISDLLSQVRETILRDITLDGR